MPISVCINKMHGTRASVIVAKTEIISEEVKNFGYITYNINKSVALQNKDISFSGKDDRNDLFQLFNNMMFTQC